MHQNLVEVTPLAIFHADLTSSLAWSQPQPDNKVWLETWHYQGPLLGSGSPSSRNVLYLVIYVLSSADASPLRHAKSIIIHFQETTKIFSFEIEIAWLSLTVVAIASISAEVYSFFHHDSFFFLNFSYYLFFILHILTVVFVVLFVL